MRLYPKVVASVLLMLAAFPAFAAVPARAVPGPVAGAGLAYLVIAGGYYIVRRWRGQKTKE